MDRAVTLSALAAFERHFAALTAVLLAVSGREAGSKLDALYSQLPELQNIRAQRRHRGARRIFGRGLHAARGYGPRWQLTSSLQELAHFAVYRLGILGSGSTGQPTLED
jgi:hypothetical protein